MDTKRFVAGLILLAALIVGLSVYGFNKTKSPESAKTVAGEATVSYFSEDASIMYFYSENCGWCEKQKTVLQELAQEGYKVKPMDVGKNYDLWREYAIEGTPTFIAANGQKIVGYQDKQELKTWMDQNK